MQQEQNYEKTHYCRRITGNGCFIQHTCAEQVSKQEISHFKLVKVGTINVSQSGGQISSPSDLREKLSELADAKGGKYYHIIAAREHGPNFEAVAEVYNDATK